MMQSSDHEQRRQATDPTRSFIVQAPAGSGKTELLTQRYLRLLATIEAPEQIIALTFTRKAANEMRERILKALHRAAQSEPSLSPHQRQTSVYATEALARDQRYNWQLLSHPTRLQIFTIDSLCQRISHAIPLQEQQIPYAKISDNPSRHYKAAAHACLEYAIQHEHYHHPLQVLLRHMDNRQDNLLLLFSKLLSTRDQWLEPIHQAKTQNKQVFEQALSWIEHHEISRFCQSIPQDCLEELIMLARQIACLEANPESVRYPLKNWNHIKELDRVLIKSLAALLLTKDHSLRKSFDHHVGLKRGVCNEKDYKQLKEASKQLLYKLDASPDFLDHLVRVKDLPSPHYDPQQWEVLQALFTLLPLLAAHLQLTFSECNEVDFTAISQQAIQALGHDEAPTDLALYLDQQIHHLLIDEFQDTSIQQFQLLERLVQGWQEDDGKTLFVVGDPMQSIYRFRSAEVGLFLRARQQGIGPVRLIPLELTCNFRSTELIVNWINQQFSTIFPNIDDIESGAISFHWSKNMHSTGNASIIKPFQANSTQEEAQAIVELVAHELQAHPQEDIAILVRSRTQLREIIRLLRKHQISFQGMDIDLLANLPHLRDVWSLTQALLMPANRLAWLSMLRSPWCGLSLADVHCIANFAQKKSIYFALSQLEHIHGLSEEGLIRGQFFYEVMHETLKTRHQQSLADWIMNTLRALHLEQVLSTHEQDDLEPFWLLLEQFEEDGQITDMEQFETELNKLYSQRVTPSRLHIMTIHKSKGLEFDCVILPGLSARSAISDKPLLRWLKLPTQQGSLLLISPMKAAHEEHCLLYDYLTRLEEDKNHYEMQRLLYVAVTRAKKRLYLFDKNDKGSQGTLRSLLQNLTFHPIESTSYEMNQGKDQSIAKTPELYHLPLTFYQHSSSYLAQSANQLSFPLHHHSRLVGIVTHELLQWICDHHPATIADIPWHMVSHQFKVLGLTGQPLMTAQSQIQTQIKQLFSDPVGHWLISKHKAEHNELELLHQQYSDVTTKIIDRTFIEHGIRWVIDFKTGQEEEYTEHQHRQQVQHYAHLLAHLYPEPIHCGLYYLANSHWITWNYEDGLL
ncbi:ATP-dependent exoDNAse exonuclease V beta subunit [Legionella oakridgensis ATCC 33761 = DSM 21215]|uniref:DNA 3'-5' helicase n=3 Tax=Legionella oakridgensis TaxID=29423 RepID=W0BD28_9GAMM|nr:ATP-dependent exoDNAse exonuclease V beta subunit [Legionella oakridgensis ATCC 33761 = DSM 21215]KTD37798.1 UvrD/REP helicase [Legionella oakridgensis]STY19749.1 UvrD/REP helicase [Legionella longbeachae]